MSHMFESEHRQTTRTASELAALASVEICMRRGFKPSTTRAAHFVGVFGITV